MHDHGRRDVVNGYGAAKLEGHEELVLEEGDDMLHSLFTAVGEAPEVGPPDEHGPGPEGERLECVSSAAHPTVKINFASTLHRFNNFR